MIKCRVVVMVAWIVLHSNVELMCCICAAGKLVAHKVPNLLQAEPKAVIQAAKPISVLLPAPVEGGGSAIEPPQNDGPSVARSTVGSVNVVAHVTKHGELSLPSWVDAIVATGLQVVQLIKLLTATTGWRI